MTGALLFIVNEGCNSFRFEGLRNLSNIRSQEAQKTPDGTLFSLKSCGLQHEYEVTCTISD